MATVTLLGRTHNTTSGTHTVVATPAVGDLIVIVTHNTGNTSTATCTDNNSSGTYTTVITSKKATNADTMMVQIRTASIASASSTTFTHAPGTSSGGGLAVYKITGMSAFGTSASFQTAKQENQAGGGTPTPVFTNAVRTHNPVIGALFNATNPAGITHRGTPSYSESFDSGYNTPTTGVEGMHISSGETASSIAWGGTSASAFCDAVIELNAPLTVNISDSIGVSENGFGSIIVDSYSESNQNTNYSLDGATFGFSQSFTGNGGVLDKAIFYLKKFSTPTGNAVAKVYAHSGTFGTSSIPTGGALATSGTFDVSTLTTSLQLITFTFTGADKISLTNATNYVVTVEYTNADPGFSNWIEVGADSTSPTHGGNAGFADTSMVWTASSGNDACFYVYADPATKDIKIGPYNINVSDNVAVSESVTIIEAELKIVMTGGTGDLIFASDNPDVNSLTVGYLQSYWYNTYWTLSAQGWFGQSFDSNIGGTLRNAKFFIRGLVTRTGNAYAEVYAHSGTYGTTSVPTGSPLATSDPVDVTTIGEADFEWVTFNFSGANKIALTASTKYVVVVHYLGQVRMAQSQFAPNYTDGNYSFSNNGTAWNYGDTDWVFQVNLDSNFIDLKGGYRAIDTSDSPTVAETVTVALPVSDLTVSVFDLATISEDITALIPNGVASVFDTVSVSESVTVLEKNLVLSVFDNASVSESVTVIEKNLVLSVFDGVGVSEDIVVLEKNYVLSVFDLSTVAETVVVFETNYVLSVFDGISVSESVQARAYPYFVNVFDGVGVSESITVLSKNLVLNVFDTVTVSENLTGKSGPLFLQTSDDAFVSEDLVIEEITEITYFDLDIFDDVLVSEDLDFGNRYWVGGPGDWSDSANHWAKESGGVPDAIYLPTSTNNVIFDANSAISSSIVNIDTTADCYDFTATVGATWELSTGGGNPLNIYGSATFEAGMSGTMYGIQMLATDPGHTLTWNGYSPTLNDVSFIGAGSWTLQDTMTLVGTLYFDGGTFDANDQNISVQTVVKTNTANIIMGSGTWELTGNDTSYGGYIWSNNGSGTITPETSTIKITDSTADNKSFLGGSVTYNNIWFTGTGTGTFILLQSNNFNDFKIDNPPHTVKFTENTTTTVNTFNVSGTAGNLITIDSVNGFSQHNLNSPSGTISCDYLNISNSNAGGGATWDAGFYSFDTTNNDGWIFQPLEFFVDAGDDVIVTEEPEDLVIYLDLFEVVGDELIEVSEDLTLEKIDVISYCDIDVYEDVYVTDSPTCAVPLVFAPTSDGVVVTDTVAIVLGSHNVVVSDSVTVSESTNFYFPILDIAVSENIFVRESTKGHRSRIKWYRKNNTVFGAGNNVTWHTKNNTSFQTKTKPNWYNKLNTSWKKEE